MLYNSKVHNLKIKFKRRAENEKKLKVDTADSVNTVSSAITPVSLTRISYNATDEQLNVVCVMRNSADACKLSWDL